MTSDNSPNQLTTLGGHKDDHIQQEDTPIRKHAKVPYFFNFKHEGIYRFVNKRRHYDIRRVGVDETFHIFSNSGLDGCERSPALVGHFSTGGDMQR
jgi:hypothetical protein